MWWSRRHPPEPADLQQARTLRAEAQEELAVAKRQAPYVARLTARLIERRALNHFGDDIQITFTPREGRRA
jgi:hypothetical protein